MKTRDRKDMVHRSWMNAITFAEAGEWETAKAMIPPAGPSSREVTSLFRIFAAAALAEGGMPVEAIRFMEQACPEKPAAEDFLKILGLDGFRLTYGVMAVERRRLEKSGA